MPRTATSLPPGLGTDTSRPLRIPVAILWFGVAACAGVVASCPVGFCLTERPGLSEIAEMSLTNLRTPPWSLGEASCDAWAWVGMNDANRKSNDKVFIASLTLFDRQTVVCRHHLPSDRRSGDLRASTLDLTACRCWGHLVRQRLFQARVGRRCIYPRTARRTISISR